MGLPVDVIGSSANLIAHARARFADATLDRDEAAEIRRAAVARGVWRKLAVQLPEHFLDAFELAGSSIASASAPPFTASNAPAVDRESLDALVGKPAFFRIVRRDGRVEVVAGLVERIDDAGIHFKRYDPAAVESLRRPGDSSFFAGLRNEEVLTLERGETLTTAIALPVSVIGRGAPGIQRYLLRERAEAVARGEYEPRVDLSDPERYLARDPATGEPWLDGDYPVFRDDFVTALHIEQNVLAMPIVHKLAYAMIAKLEDPETIAAAASDRDGMSADALDELVRFPAATAVFDEIEREPSGPLSRALANMQKIVTFTHTFLPTKDFNRPYSARGLITAGAGTAITVCRETLEFARSWADHDPSLDATTIMRATRPMIARAASMPLQVFNTVRNEVTDELPLMALFGQGDKAFVDFSPELLEHVSERLGIRVGSTMVAGTTGCPAAQMLFGQIALNDFVLAFADFSAAVAAERQRVRATLDARRKPVG